MDKLFEIGELGVIRDIPAELTQLETANRSLTIALRKNKDLVVFLGICMAGLVIYIVIMESTDKPNKKK